LIPPAAGRARVSREGFLGKLLTKLLLLFAPVLACAAFVFLVDPFNYFGIFKTIPDMKKREIVYKDDRVWWNTIDYARSPCPGVVIGDSRADRISVEHLTEKTGMRYKHLSASACKLNEIEDLFRFGTSHARLESVYIVLNFNIFNQYAFDERVAGVLATIKNPFLYLTNRHVIGMSCRILKSVMFQNESGPRKPGTKNDFWEWSLEHWPNQQYGKWKYPAGGYGALRRISDYCRRNSIDLTFIIAPVHADYRRKVDQFNLSAEQIRFKKDIAKLSTTVDFDFDNDLTGNKENFTDPVHITKEVADRLMDEILTGKFHYGRLLENR
jgi:hypothetical protein